MKKTLAVLAVLALAALGMLVTPTAASAAAGGTVTVTLTDQASTPITGAYVEILHNNGSITIQETATPGTYSLANMTPGSFLVKATASGYATEYSGDTPVRANATPVVVADGGTTNLAMVMGPESKLQGTVTDHLGQPVSANVLLYSSNEGWNVFNQVSTDPSNGKYSFPGLGLGDYKILVYTSNSPNDATQWYTDANTIDTATVIHVTGATAVADIQLEQAAQITGTVTNSIGHPLSISLEAVPAGATAGFSDAVTNGASTYSIEGLLSGSYTVKAFDNAHFFQTQTSGAVGTTVANTGHADFVMVPQLPTEAALTTNGTLVAPVSGPTQVTAGHSYTWVVNDTDTSDVYAAIYSTPVYLGAFPHDAGGTTATITVTIPAGTTAGAHSLSFLSYHTDLLQENAQFYFPIQVSAATLAKTGTDSTLPIGFGILLLLSGAAAVAIARRRTNAAAS